MDQRLDRVEGRLDGVEHTMSDMQVQMSEMRAQMASDYNNSRKMFKEIAGTLAAKGED